jgi:hypothetical protein
MKDKNKIILVLVVSMIVVTFCTLLGFGMFRLIYPGSPRDLPLIGTIASAGDRLFNPSDFAPTPITATTSSYFPINEQRKTERTECKDFFDIAFSGYGASDIKYKFVNGFDIYGYPDANVTTEQLIDRYYYTVSNDPTYMALGVYLLGDDYQEYDARFRGKNLMVFTVDNCRYEVNLKDLGIRKGTLLSHVFYDKDTKSLYFEAGNYVGVYYDSTGVDPKDMKSSIKSYTYDVKTRTFTVKDVPFEESILKADNSSNYFYIVEQQRFLNTKDKISYFLVRYESSADGCGLSCIINLGEISKIDLKTVNSKIGVYAYHYDTGKLEKVYSTTLYDPTNKSLFMGGEVSIEYPGDGQVEKAQFTEKREIKQFIN